LSNNDFAFFVTTTLGVYKECAQKATRGLIKNWILLVGSVISYLIYHISAEIFGPMGFGGGLIIGLVIAVLTAIYYSWIADTIKRDKLRFQSLYQIDYGFLFTTINVAFILFLPQYLVSSLIRGLDVDWIFYCLLLGIVIVFNAIPEVIIINRFDGTHALGHAATFTRDNWIEWFLPFLILVLPWLFISPPMVLMLLVGSNPLLPVTMLVVAAALTSKLLAIPTAIAIAIALVVANWFMLFRAHLFTELESGTRRQRMYRARQR
jgi:hypothetical protein